jgi:hypothetical protein
MDTPVTTNQDGTPNASPVEDRIAAIVGQRNQAQGQVTSLQTENAVLAEKLASLEQKISQVQTNMVSEPSSEQRLDRLLAADQTISAEGKPTARAKDGPDIAALVAAAVSKAISPITEKIDKAEQQSVLKTQHNVSFSKAVELVPELLDKDSEVSKTAERLWQGRPDIANLPDAPLVFAQIAKGIVADVRKVDKTVTDRKRQAAVQSPAPASRVVTEPSVQQELQAKGEEVTKDVLGKSAGVNDLANMFRVALGNEIAGAAED